MRIAIYSINYAPEPTSTGKYTGEMASWFAQRGHHVHVVAPLPHYPQWRIYNEYKGKGFLGFHRENLDGVEVMRCPLYVPSSGRVTAKTRIAYETTFCLSAGRYFLPRCLPTGSRPHYDVVIAVCPPVQTAVYPWLLQLTHRVPWVFHIQDLQVDAAIRLGILRNRRLASVMSKIESFFLRRATRVSTITEPMRQRIVQRGVPQERTLLLPNWANLDVVKPTDTNNFFRHQLGFSSDDMVLMYAGNMGQKQGLEGLLSAIDRLRNDKRLRFILVGSGVARTQIESSAAKMGLIDQGNLTLLPVQPIEKLSSMLAVADVHLIIQRQEAADLVMPSKLTNILAAGRPTIATADPETALGQLIENEHIGLACKPNCTEALVAAIQQLAGNTQLRRQMGYNARRYAEMALSQDLILSRFESQLQAVNIRHQGRPIESDESS